MLQEIFDRQYYLQTKVYGYDFEAMTDEERIAFIKDMVLATEDELHEALGEVGWKPWATSRHVNREAYRGELVDALHFFVNLCLVAGITAEELTEAYMAKTEINVKRQEEGYDGVTTKCPMCGRALDDPAVDCEVKPHRTTAYCGREDYYVQKGHRNA